MYCCLCSVWCWSVLMLSQSREFKTFIFFFFFTTADENVAFIVSQAAAKLCVLLVGAVWTMKPQCGHFIHHYLLTDTIWIMTHFPLDSGIMAQTIRDNTRPLKENYINPLNILKGLDWARTRRVEGRGAGEGGRRVVGRSVCLSVCRIRSSEPQIMEHSASRAAAPHLGPRR